MIRWFSKERFLTKEDNTRIVEAIKSTEKLTSGEIRIYIESKNPLVNTLERAKEIFTSTSMHKTRQRNAVLLYIAVKDREVALFGDEGIHQQVGSEFWNQQVGQMIAHFKQNNLADGIVACVTAIGNVLIKKFPFNAAEDKNELPDDILFGK